MKFLEKLAKTWINKIPKVYPCNTLHEDGVKAIFYDGFNKTRVFAWIGLPEHASAEHPVPGIVLIHGGLGTAFAHWVRYWNRQGYAAISMDTCGAMPLPDHKSPKIAGRWPRHKWSGAEGWGAYKQYRRKPEDQWFPHAVSAVMFGHNLLRSMPEVDANRIGITGVSWGGVLTLLSAGLDPRYKAACPVYGNGFLCNDKINDTRFAAIKKSPKGYDWWVNEWDCSNFLDKIRAHVLWFASTNDMTIFYPRYWQKSVDLVKNSEQCMKIRWPHTHGPFSEEQPEIREFFRQYLENGPKRLSISGTKRNGNTISASISGKKPMSVLLSFTCDTNPNWFGRRWHQIPASMEGKRVFAALPKGWQAAYLSCLTGDLQEVTSGIVFASSED